MAEDGFFEEDESPEAVARLAAEFAKPRRFTREPDFHWQDVCLVGVVETIRRQSEREVRESIVADLKDRVDGLLAKARRLEARLGPGEVLEDGLAAAIDEASYCRWMVSGFPGRGWSISWHVETMGLGMHRVEVRGAYGSRGNRFEAECRECGTVPGWSPTVIGAKRLARRHAGLM